MQEHFLLLLVISFVTGLLVAATIYEIWKIKKFTEPKRYRVTFISKDIDETLCLRKDRYTKEFDNKSEALFVYDAHSTALFVDTHTNGYLRKGKHNLLHKP